MLRPKKDTYPQTYPVNKAARRSIKKERAKNNEGTFTYLGGDRQAESFLPH